MKYIRINDNILLLIYIIFLSFANIAIKYSLLLMFKYRLNNILKSDIYQKCSFE